MIYLILLFPTNYYLNLESEYSLKNIFKDVKAPNCYIGVANNISTQEEQDKFITACRSIIDRPRHRLHGREVYLRADKLKRVPSVVENEVAEHRMDFAHLYRVEEQIQSNDTQENRFLKYALQQITSKYDALKKRIETIRNYSIEQKEQMDKMLQTLKHLGCHPFFRTVGKFKGFNQESLILQRATGYSQVYRIWNMLKRAYSLNDGIYRLQSKDIATLYEIWCFIEVSHIVRDQLGLTQDDLDHQNRMEMNGIFTWELGKGEHSKILFKKDNVELAELMYNPKHAETENDITGINNMVARTVPQKPDIVLQLTKNDLHRDMKMTYLFDAKYRISGKDSKGVDTPPDDAINQMHRYRDAIYYKEYDSAPLKKEVIGGGDLKLILATSLFLGWQLMLLGIFLGSFIACLIEIPLSRNEKLRENNEYIHPFYLYDRFFHRTYSR